MNPQARQNLLLLGNDTELSYLLGRFAEQSEYQLTVVPEKASIQEITAAKPSAIIFSSMGFLSEAQNLVVELASLEVPIIVCSSLTDQGRARVLGADSCLLHPITLDGFQNALAVVSTTKRA